MTWLLLLLLSWLWVGSPLAQMWPNPGPGHAAFGGGGGGADITTGLTIWLKFDEASGTTAADSSGNSRPGTLVSGAAFTATACKVNNCLAALDGVDDHVTLGGLALSTFITSTAGTLAIWAKPTGTAVLDDNVYELPAIVADTGGFVGLFRGSLSGVDNLYAYNYDSAVASIGVAYTADVWTHLVWVHGGGTLSLYKDGVLVGTPVTSGATTTLTSPLLVANGFQTATFQGQLDEFRAYSRALNASEVAALYNFGIALRE